VIEKDILRVLMQGSRTVKLILVPLVQVVTVRNSVMGGKQVLILIVTQKFKYTTKFTTIIFKCNA
jgi:hypothetical protein